jgi:hypothetical protein
MSAANTTEAQRQRLLERLKQSPLDTLTARKELDIMHPGGRVKELRWRGYNIQTVYIQRVNEDSGEVHRIGRYVLMTDAAATAPASEAPAQEIDKENAGGTPL